MGCGHGPLCFWTTSSLSVGPHGLHGAGKVGHVSGERASDSSVQLSATARRGGWIGRVAGCGTPTPRILALPELLRCGCSLDPSIHMLVLGPALAPWKLAPCCPLKLARAATAARGPPSAAEITCSHSRHRPGRLGCCVSWRRAPWLSSPPGPISHACRLGHAF
jgi:hypothetical protein